MNGQWIGKYSGSNYGLIVANIDDRQSHFGGVAYLSESKNSLPGTAASFRTQNRDRNSISAPT